MLNKNEVVDFLNKLSDSDKSELMSGYNYGILDSLDSPTKVVVDNYGGEDQGYTYYAVWKFDTLEGPFYVKFYGWYASYDGASYEGFVEVKPREVTKVEYL
jgi:hypothetical protein